MPKKYQLLIDSPELHNGAVAELQEKEEVYKVVFSRGAHYLSPEQVENRPTVWQEIVEEPEKKIVERWRGKKGESYNALYCVDREDQHQVDSQHYDQGEYFASTQVSNRAQKRVQIMCRLMGLAETIEEGSTEMKGKWKITYSLYSSSLIVVEYGYSHPVHANYNLATFSTEKLAQLFLDSAGQDAIDWYGVGK